MRFKYLFFLIPFLCGATWYVRPSGGSYGVENGTSYGNAFDGFSNIAWNSMAFNDTLYICGQHNETLFLSKDGNSTAQFILRGDYSGDNGIIDAGGLDRCINYVSSGAYIDFIGLHLKNPSTNHLYIGTGTGGLTPAPKMRFYNMTFEGGTQVALRYASTEGEIKDSTFINCTGGGIMTYSSPHILIENITTINCGTLGNYNTDSIGVNDGSYGAVVRNVFIYDQKGSAGSGIDMQDSIPSNETEYVYNAYVINSSGHGITLGGNVPVKAINCVAKNNTASNLNSHSNIDTYFIHCTADTGLYGLKGGNTVDAGAANVTLINTILTNVTVNIFLNKLNATIIQRNNIYSPNGTFQRYNGTGTTTYNWTNFEALGYTGENITFADPLLNGYLLSPTSPAIDAGADVGVREDYRGIPRPRGTSPDIGAIEYTPGFQIDGANITGGVEIN